MSDHLSSTVCVGPIKHLRCSAVAAPSQPASNRPRPPICTINGDILLNVFYLYQLHIVYEEEDEYALSIRKWDRQRWWYKLVHVCRWWRFIILSSPSVLDLHLVCTYGVPVEDMLKHSLCPGLPLTIFYDGNSNSPIYEMNSYRYYEMTRKDEEGVLLAISHSRDCVRRIALRVSTPTSERLIAAMKEGFPILEHLYLETPIKDPGLKLPQTFQAPNLRHIHLSGVPLPMQAPLLMTTRGLVFLWLEDVPGSAYFSPNHMLTQLSLIPQLEMFGIDLVSTFSDYKVVDVTIIAQVTLPNLGLFYFQGFSTYLEGLLSRITAPVLRTFHVRFLDQPAFTIPQPFQFLESSENLIFNTFEVAFHQEFVELKADPHQALWKRPLYLRIICGYPVLQLAFAVRILHALSTILSFVEKASITLDYPSDPFQLWRSMGLTHGLNHGVTRTPWHKFLRSFSNVKVLHVKTDLVLGLSRSLHSEDGESPLELLPHLEELTYSGEELEVADTFRPFIDERKAAGHPVRLRQLFDRASLAMYQWN